MCPKYTEVKQRMEQGAEIYKATNPDSEAEVSSDEESMSVDESMSISEEKNGYYHCYKSCATYDDRCTYPEECEQQKRGEKPCPIKIVLGDHWCGEVSQMPEREFNRANKIRKTNNQLFRTGIVGDMIKYRETREYFQVYKRDNSR